MALTSVALVDAVGSLLRIPWYLPDFWSVFPASVAIRLPVDIFTYWLLLGFWEVSRGHEKYRHQKQLALQSELQLSDLRIQLATAQLAALKNQLQPHFLFNTLNTISSLIQDDPKLAESLLGKLAALLRFSLDSNQQRVSPLGREMKIVRDYLEIERARFGDRLRYEIAVPPEMESAEAPAFSLQTLVENSVKHAVANRIEGGTIRVRARAGSGEICLEVCDDGPGFTADAIRTGHGLHNLQSRLEALFGSEARLEISNEAGQTAVRLRFPV